MLTYAPPPNVHGILAAPPCTHFSIARSRAKTPRDLRGAMRVVEACLRIIWECSYSSSLQWWALENPRGILQKFLGRPALTFQPWEYGDPHYKITQIWGRFTVPEKPPVAPDQLAKIMQVKGTRWGDLLPPLPAGYVVPPGQDRVAARRAITPAGFARAFFEANR